MRAAGGGRFSHALSKSARLSMNSSAAYNACFVRPRKQILVLRALALKGRATGSWTSWTATSHAMAGTAKATLFINQARGFTAAPCSTIPAKPAFELS